MQSTLQRTLLLALLCTNAFSETDSLNTLLQKLDRRLVAQCEKAVRASLDQRLERYGAYGVYPRKDRNWTTDSINVDLEEGHLPNTAVRFLRAYETFGEVAYLQAGLKTADFFIQIQHENGCFPTAARLEKGGKATAIVGRKHKHPLGVARMEDAHQYPAFCLLLYAYKLTGQEKYLNQAKQSLVPEPILMTASKDGITVEVAMEWTDAYHENMLCFTNNIPQRDGGAHLAGFRAAMTRVVNAYAQSSGIAKREKVALTGEDSREVTQRRLKEGVAERDPLLYNQWLPKWSIFGINRNLIGSSCLLSTISLVLAYSFRNFDLHT